ncbi:MAG: transketolase [Gammaproteobacteria bacterium]|nr:transketolase [Gammaproteobacteria bacterium]NND36983.1 transketolase [Gammaproteobacteria bacterium]
MATTPTTAVSRPERIELANALRALAMDAVQAAKSGHPGMPMGMADIAEVLWNDFLQHDPSDPTWPDRDRFVLSNGHGSMLLYGLLHLSGYPLTMDHLRDFRQLGSPTAGHPEREPELGIETTTGPLGQGVTNAVGMALAEKVLAAQFNRPDYPVVDHYTYVFLGDGCLMEGISHEACSLAGTLELGKLICLYDDNGISIDGEVEGWFTDDTPARFEAYGWQVVREVDGHDAEDIRSAIDQARANTDQPTLICCKTVIGFGAPNKQGTEATHGAPLGEDEVAAARKRLGWSEPPFSIPEEVYAGWDATAAGAAFSAEWGELLEAYTREHPDLAAEFRRRMAGELPEDWSEFADRALETIDGDAETVATRKASLIALNAFAPDLPELIGGSADLTGSNLTNHAGSKLISDDDADGNYISFGVREFGMAAILNGIALHGGFIPYGGTFLTFSDYSRNALRMAALMRIRTIHVFTHDSIGLGEDGPTHQAVEHVSSLRLIPNMRVWRPCDTIETAVAWRDAVERQDGPTSLVLTRQAVPFQARDAGQRKNVRRGGYVLSGEADPSIVLIATGSEVGLAVSAAELLIAEGIPVRVVSMPCAELFLEQDASYRESVLPSAVTKRVAIEAGSTGLWYRFVGTHGRIVGLDQFGQSAPAGVLFEHFGFTPENVAATARELLEK